MPSITSDLLELGLSEGEAGIYLALLRLGSANVMQLSKATGRHRTHIYDTMEKLKEKGLASESVIDNKKVIIPSDPENILDYLREKEEKAKTIRPELHVLKKLAQKEIKVETYKGASGLKSVFRDILRERADYLGYGEGERFQHVLPGFYEQFRVQSEKLGIKLRLIFKKGVKISGRKGLEVRYLDYISPTTTFIYGNKIAIIIWEPQPTAIKITDRQTADSYRNYFEILWKNARK